MTNDILILDGSYHLGDNFGIFQSSTYIGLKLALPLRQTWLNPEVNVVSFIFSTTDLETWGDWLGHKVSINNIEIGRLKDRDNFNGSLDEFVIDVPKNTYVELLEDKESFVLEIELERQETMPGFSDDFRLVRVVSREVALRIG